MVARVKLKSFRQSCRRVFPKFTVVHQLKWKVRETITDRKRAHKQTQTQADSHNHYAYLFCMRERCLICISCWIEMVGSKPVVFMAKYFIPFVYHLHFFSRTSQLKTHIYVWHMHNITCIYF